MRIRHDKDGETPIDLPKSNVLEFRMEGDCKIIVRPSGTEPKIKVYLSAKGKDLQEGIKLIEILKKAGTDLIQPK